MAALARPIYSGEALAEEIDAVAPVRFARVWCAGSSSEVRHMPEVTENAAHTMVQAAEHCAMCAVAER